MTNNGQHVHFQGLLCLFWINPNWLMDSINQLVFLKLSFNFV